MVNDDMPFIVDSVALVLGRQKLTMHVTVHPVIRVRRNNEGELTELVDEETGAIAESFVHIEVDRETDVDILNALTGMIHESMQDVRAATGDWQAMRTKMIEIRNNTQGQSYRLSPPGQGLLGHYRYRPRVHQHSARLHLLLPIL